MSEREEEKRHFTTAPSRRDRPDSIDEKDLQDSGELTALTAAVKHKLKNGCCRDCMKAFSKSGKSCLCQVPRLQRRSTLPSKGCKFCGCKGCNPIDIRKDKRQEIKKKLKDEGKYYAKRHRLLDSDDEELLLYNDMDNWVKTKKEFTEFMAQILNSEAGILGLGIPVRSPSYIFGAQHKWVSEQQNYDQ